MQALRRRTALASTGRRRGGLDPHGSSWSRTTLMLSLVVAMLVALVSANPAVAQDPAEDYDVLFFHLTTGFRHASIPDAIAAVEELGADNGFTVTET